MRRDWSNKSPQTSIDQTPSWNSIKHSQVSLIFTWNRIHSIKYFAYDRNRKDFDEWDL